MPTSRSTKLGTRRRRDAAAAAAAEARRPIWPLVALGALAALAILLIALPASMIGRLLPASITMQDFSGSVWHGSAGRITVNGRDAGALEWRLHPAALLGLTLAADLHWVKAAFVADGGVRLDRHSLGLARVTGGGPLESLQSLGIAPGWHGSATLAIDRLQADLDAAGPQLRTAVGELRIAELSSPAFAGGEPLGGFALRLAEGAIGADGSGSARLADTGGPLALDAVIQFSVKERRGIASGTVAVRAQAGEALRAEIDKLAQLRPRDPQGRVPFDLELSL